MPASRQVGSVAWHVVSEPVPVAVEMYVSWMAEELMAIFGERLAGLYLHGSGAMGGWHPRLSDVDILAVVADRASDDEKQLVTDLLHGAGHRPPGSGVEFSLVSSSTFGTVSASPAFELHATTGADTKVVDGDSHPGDPDLVLHYAVCRARGVAFAGAEASLLLPAYPRRAILDALSAELVWARDHAPWRYIVLNACRAWAFAEEGSVLSKVDGGDWALVRGIEPGAVAAALDAQRGNIDAAVRDGVQPLVEVALAALANAKKSEAR